MYILALTQNQFANIKYLMRKNVSMQTIISGLIIRHPVSLIYRVGFCYNKFFLDPYTRFLPICEVNPFPVWAIIVIVVFVLIVILSAITGWFLSFLILMKVYIKAFERFSVNSLKIPPKTI